jgi:ribosomal protein S18 acetylase RimI-like enzyme
VNVAVDWRDADPADVVPLVSAEAKLWLSLLDWDVADAWHVIEPARLAGQLPGAVLIDPSGRPVGWTAYLLHGDSLQVMALVAPDEAGTRALLDTILKSDEASKATHAVVCVRDVSPGLERELRERGFSVEPYRYLRAPIAGVVGDASEFREWPPAGDEIADLFRRAYAEDHTVRAFAPEGRLDEWVEYISQLQKGPGCGWFRPDLSMTSRQRSTGRLEAAILVTHLGPGTVHIAQLAVDPSVRRTGVARRLVGAALGRARTEHDRATLLVSQANHPAGALYESLGFGEVARFVVATQQRHAAGAPRVNAAANAAQSLVG